MIFEKKVLDYYKKILLCRHDPDGSVFYFSKADFDGLISEDSHFFGDKGQRLQAHLYYRGQKRYDRLIIFEHGMGCGHAAYLREINEITERGYTVFTYDHTGTLNSEGENIGGFSQSLSDLDRAVDYVKTLEGYENAKLTTKEDLEYFETVMQRRKKEQEEKACSDKNKKKPCSRKGAKGNTV